jgi:hypothetical protein
MHRKNTRIETISNDIALVPLTRGMMAIIDVCDIPLIAEYSWSSADMDGWFYARTTLPDDSKLLMHRLLLNVQAGELADHVNGFTLDNRRSNLRIATSWQNSGNALRHRDNTSGFKGVVRSVHGTAWTAQITHQGKNYYLGKFDDPAEAARAYDAKAIEFRGEFARVNFPHEWDHVLRRLHSLG